MKKLQKTAVTLGAALALALSVSGAALAAPAEYSYLAGQQRSAERDALYAQAAAIEDEAARDAFLASYGIGETAYSAQAAAGYSYVAVQQRGASYGVAGDDDAAQKAGYAYVTGRQRGASYAQ